MKEFFEREEVHQLIHEAVINANERLIAQFLDKLKILDRNEEHWITEWGEMLPWHFIEKIIKYYEDY